MPVDIHEERSNIWGPKIDRMKISEYKIIANQANLDQIVKDIFIQNTSASDSHKLDLFKTKFMNTYLQIISTYEYLQNKLEKEKISIYPIPNIGIGKAINERLLRAQAK